MTDLERPRLPLTATTSTTASGCTDCCCTGSGCTDACCSTSSPSADQRGSGHDAAWTRAARRARALSWVSLLWMTAEGALGLVAGIRTQSVSLVGWALGSVIEALASIIVIWRFTGARTRSETAEAQARRAVAVSFFLLAPYIAVQAVRDLLVGHQSAVSSLGIAVTVASLLVMPLLGVAKQRLGRVLDSGATAGEGVQNLMCAAQAGAVLVGLAVTATVGWSWVDPAIALLLAGWAVKEGVEAWNSKDCC
jgi:divalent metal cation (Fe/Co/Zn/Cd) transporter